MSNHRENFLEKYTTEVCRLKGITEVGKINACKRSITRGFDVIYNVVCFDIDGTICERGEIDPSEKIINQITRLVEKRIITVFITGRGRPSSREILRSLRDKIKAQKKDINDRYFDRWYCITHNGAYLLKSTNKRFLNSAEFIAAEEKKATTLILSERITSLRSKLEDAFDDPKLKIQTEPTSVRVVTEREVNREKIAKTITKIIAPPKGVKLLKGVYGKGSVFEFSTTTKYDAIKKAEDYLGIPRISMIRIGDQGQVEGNDNEMLRSSSGFSVHEFSTSTRGCFPVLDENFKQIKGPEGTRRILSIIRTSTALSIEKPNRDTFPRKLMNIEKYSTLRSTALLRKYSVLLSSWLDIDNPLFNINPYTFLLELFDGRSGAVKFRDWEWGLIPSSSIIKRVYDIKVQPGSENTNKYSLHTDTSVILRGAYNYYYGSCEKTKDTNWAPAQVEKWLEFVQVVKDEISNEAGDESHFEYADINSKKFILALLDNLRNITLTCLNYHLNHKEVVDRNSFEILSEDLFKDETKLFLGHALKASELFYLALFRGVKPFDLNTISDLTVEIEKELIKLKTDSELKKSKTSLFKEMREIDFFVENLVAVDLAFNKFSDTYTTFNDSKINIYSLLSGGIEMSIISKSLGDQWGLSVDPKFLYLPGNYLKRHNSREDPGFENKFPNEFLKGPRSEEFHFLGDDNILTGKTLQIGIDYLVSKGLDPDGAIIVRYPGINRLEHMYLPDHGAPDPDLFFNFIRGLVSPSPYTKLFKNTDGENEYTNRDGIFKKNKERIMRYLKKNGVEE